MSQQNIKLVEKPQPIKPFQWRPLTHDEYVRVDSQCAGPAKFEDQIHIKFDNELMKKVLAKHDKEQDSKSNSRRSKQ